MTLHDLLFDKYLARTIDDIIIQRGIAGITGSYGYITEALKTIPRHVAKKRRDRFQHLLVEVLNIHRRHADTLYAIHKGERYPITSDRFIKIIRHIAIMQHPKELDDILTEPRKLFRRLLSSFPDVNKSCQQPEKRKSHFIIDTPSPLNTEILSGEMVFPIENTSCPTFSSPCQ